jgi:uncharacterized membrane protein YeaQ/YmgE (transglycosylase-associated protein family)
MATLITIADGIVMGLLCRRFAAAHSFSTVADIMLGITGAFAGRSLVDVLTRIGVNAGSYSWVFALCGAALLPWTFHRFGRRQAQNPKGPSVSRQDSLVSKKIAKSQMDSTKTRARAA